MSALLLDKPRYVYSENSPYNFRPFLLDFDFPPL